MVGGNRWEGLIEGCRKMMVVRLGSLV